MDNLKLFTDMSTEIVSEIEINESTSAKTYVIKGTFSSPGKKNRNGRVYSEQIWEHNVQRYQEEIKNNSINTLAELEHPARTTVNPWEAVAKTRLLEMRGGVVYGEMEILNNNSKETNQLKALIEAGVKIGVSTRGVGRLKGQIVEEYQLVTTDIVSNPSDYGANLQGFSESMIFESKNFQIEDGRITCDDNGCTLIDTEVNEAKEVNEANKVNEAKELCTHKISNLINIIDNFNTPVIISENEIKAFDIIAIFEKKPTYQELQDKIKDTKEQLKMYKKGDDEWEALTFELETIEDYILRFVNKGRE